MTLRRALELALLFGTLAGFAEITIAAWILVIERTIVIVHPWFPLLTVVTNLAVFSLAALALHLSGSARVVTGGMAALFVVSAVLARPLPVHWIATLVLAAGAGKALCDIRIPTRLAVGTGAILLVTSAQLGYLTSRRDVPTPRTDTEPPDTNVVLLVLDTVRAKSLGLYGGREAVSPTLDSLDAHALVFERAIAPAPWTLPSQEYPPIPIPARLKTKRAHPVPGVHPGRR